MKMTPEQIIQEALDLFRLRHEASYYRLSLSPELEFVLINVKEFVLNKLLENNQEDLAASERAKKMGADW